MGIIVNGFPELSQRIVELERFSKDSLSELQTMNSNFNRLFNFISAETTAFNVKNRPTVDNKFPLVVDLDPASINVTLEGAVVVTNTPLTPLWLAAVPILNNNLASSSIVTNSESSFDRDAFDREMSSLTTTRHPELSNTNVIVGGKLDCNNTPANPLWQAFG